MKQLLIRMVSNDAIRSSQQHLCYTQRRIQGDKVEHRRREYRGAEGAEGVESPSPLGEKSGEGVVPPPQKIFFDFRSKNIDF